MARSADAQPVTAAMARRRRRRWALWAGVALLAGLAIADRGRVILRGGDDWRRFDSRSVVVLQVQEDLSLRARSGEGEAVVVRLMGVGGTIHPSAQSELERRCAGKVVTLALEPTQTRDAEGRLLAYVYDADHSLVNLVVISEGLAGADGMREHRLRGTFEQAQAAAQRARRGVWGLEQ